MEKNKTAVEWFAEQVEQYILTFGSPTMTVLRKFKKAKEMEKMQVKEAFDEGNWFSDSYHDCEHYYNKTYGKE